MESTISTTLDIGTPILISSISCSISEPDILRGLGMGGRSRPPSPDIASQITAAYQQVAALNLVRPAAVIAFHEIKSISENEAELTCGKMMPGSLFKKRLPTAVVLATAICTIGPFLEKHSSKLMHSSDPLCGYLVDGIGSAAIARVSDDVANLIKAEVRFHGFQASSRFSPGMRELPISNQRVLFDLLPAAQIGVSLTPTALMHPRKTTSFVIAAGTNMPVVSESERCRECKLSKTCRYGDGLDPCPHFGSRPSP